MIDQCKGRSLGIRHYLNNCHVPSFLLVSGKVDLWIQKISPSDINKMEKQPEIAGKCRERLRGFE